MKRNGHFIAAVCILLAMDFAAAQEPSRGPDGGAKTRVPGVEVLNIAGKPFSATTTTDWTRTLEDGSKVTEHLVAKLARDSHGRVYRERHSFVPSGTNAKAPLNEIHMMDPVSRSQVFCSTHSMECDITYYKPVTFFNPQPAGLFANGTRDLERESLGSDRIEGIFVTGTRETVTTEAGLAGNAQPIVTVREFWYSDELQTNLAITRIDPFEGRQVIRLSNISIGEPEAHLFDLPIGYRIRDLRLAPQRGN
jgi:hypothetical protein